MLTPESQSILVPDMEEEEIIRFDASVLADTETYIGSVAIEGSNIKSSIDYKKMRRGNFQLPLKKTKEDCTMYSPLEQEGKKKIPQPKVVLMLRPSEYDEFTAQQINAERAREFTSPEERKSKAGPVKDTPTRVTYKRDESLQKTADSL